MFIQIKIATDQTTKEKIYHFRYKIESLKVHSEPPLLDHNKQWLTDQADEDAYLFYAEYNNQIIGTVRLLMNSKKKFSDSKMRKFYNTEPAEKKFGKDTLAICDSFMIDPGYKGHTLSSLLILALYQYCLNKGVTLIFSSCHPSMLKLFHRLGFKRYLNYKSATETPLVLCVRDYKHLLSVMSPFALSLNHELDDQGATLEFLKSFYSKIETEINVSPVDLHIYWSEFADSWCRLIYHKPGIFDQISKEEVQMILEQCERLFFKAGDQVQIDFEDYSTIGILLKGKIGDHLKEKNHEIWFEIFKEGDTIGEAIVPKNSKSSSRLIALEDSEIYIIPPNLIENVRRIKPLLATRLSMNMITFMQQRLTNFDSSLETVQLQPQISIVF